MLADWKLELTTSRLDVALELRPAAKRPLRNNGRVRFFIGTSETIGRAILLDPAGEIAPKHSGLAQLVLKEPVVALCGDRFVIRDETNLRTLGGGVVLNPAGRRVRKPLEAYVEKLSVLRTSSGAAAIAIEALLGLQENFAMTAPQSSPASQHARARGRGRDRRFALREAGARRRSGFHDPAAMGRI